MAKTVSQSPNTTQCKVAGGKDMVSRASSPTDLATQASPSPGRKDPENIIQPTPPPQATDLFPALHTELQLQIIKLSASTTPRTYDLNLQPSDEQRHPAPHPGLVKAYPELTYGITRLQMQYSEMEFVVNDLNFGVISRYIEHTLLPYCDDPSWLFANKRLKILLRNVKLDHDRQARNLCSIGNWAWWNAKCPGLQVTYEVQYEEKFLHSCCVLERWKKTDRMRSINADSWYYTMDDFRMRQVFVPNALVCETWERVIWALGRDYTGLAPRWESCWLCSGCAACT